MRKSVAMRTLADKCVSGPWPAGFEVDFRLLSGRLSVPSANHVPIDFSGVCERYVFDGITDEEIDQCFADENIREYLVNVPVSFPNNPCWIECNRRYGFFIERDYWRYGYRIRAVLSRKGAFYGIVYYEYNINEDILYIVDKNNNAIDKATSKNAIFFKLLLLLMVVLNTPHAATVERVRMLDDGRTAAERASIRRRAQRYGGVFSFNRVTLNPLAASIMRGDLRVNKGSGASVRAHKVRGHWRLIQKCESPYFVWVEEFEQGSRELGYVAKERHVQISEGTVRKGFVVPQQAGAPGVRLPAVRAQGSLL